MSSLFPCILENSSVSLVLEMRDGGGGTSSHVAQVGLELSILFKPFPLS